MEPEGPPVVARDAATVILARDAAGGAEVLLLERHGRSRMAPGAFAFPGGRVEADDSAPDWERLCRGLTAAEAARVLPDVPPSQAIGFWTAAIREVFEETGLLLAYDRAGAPFASRTLASTPIAEYRARCRDDSRAFRALVAGEGLALATDRMAYWAHWITPEERPVRYDTRFFVAAAPPGGTPEPDGIEVVGARWLTAAAALAQHRAGALTLPAVTQEILGSIRPYPTATALVAAAAAREIRPIRPRIVLADGQERILLPGDPGWF
ncbi:MAG TPA: NUDIX hydrolase [Methylomirabilota bacterium]|nr:NUDIX hydrolase [Methylomirabilota bacterium]